MTAGSGVSGSRAGPAAAPLCRRIAIIGLGLIGGSLGLACRVRGLAHEVWGADVDADHRSHALALGCVDAALAEPAAAVQGADLVVVAVPVGDIPLVVEQIAPQLAAGAIVTDVGSVKVPVAALMDRWFPRGEGVPGHPIAGREQSGPCAASGELFVGARCVLTPTRLTDAGALRRVRELWARVGAEVLEMTPERHDRVCAAVSHLPHIVAYALMGTILDLADDGEAIHDLAAGGLKDFTRVAMSHPVMWRDICLANRDRILEMIGRFQQAVDDLATLIRARDGEGLFRQFARARVARQAVGSTEVPDDRARAGS